MPLFSKVGTMRRPLHIGSTPYIEIGHYGEMSLRYYSLKNKAYPSKLPPVLMVPSIINKSYILDLLPERSLVEYFVEKGLDVYFVDWGEESSINKLITFDDMICKRLNHFVDLVREESGHHQVHLFGHCLGGTLGLIYSTLYSHKLKSLTMVTAPVDFEKAGILGDWAQSSAFNARLFAQAFERAPSWLLQSVFQLARPASWPLKLQKLATRLHDVEFVKFFLALEYWSWDGMDLPQGLYKGLVQDLYRHNSLVRDCLKAGDRHCSLDLVKIPILSVSVEDDHVVPPSCVLKQEHVPYSLVETQFLKGGHVGGVLGRYAQKHHWSQWIDFMKNNKEQTPCQTFI
jgi:polyhydroxyalkanoate synthase subunit PhaC